MTESYVHIILKMICKRFHVSMVTVIIDAERKSSSYTYYVDEPHKPTIVLRPNEMNYIIIIHELAHHLTYEYYGNTFHGFVHNWFMEQIRVYLFWEE